MPEKIDIGTGFETVELETPEDIAAALKPIIDRVVALEAKATGAGGSYDDTALKQEISDLRARVANLETKVDNVVVALSKKG